MKSYGQCATRIESRGANPPTKEYVDALVEAIQKAGVEASWHSAVDHDCRALFPSKVYPNCHPQASIESFHYLIRRLHEIGRPVLSWYSLNHCIGLVEAHPDWQIAPMQGKGIPAPPEQENPKRYCCINSPYGELLPKFAVEIVRDVGFDGIWFDGSSFATGGNKAPGCLCAYCRERFRRDTGLDLPETPDFESHAFRLWVNWRYDCLMEAWKRTVDAVLAVKPEATICFNNYRRRRPDIPAWATGIPMRRLGWDVIMSGELDSQPLQADFQMKMHRAYGCKRGVESWIALCDHWNLWAPDIDPLHIQQAAVAAISAGGVASCGCGVHPSLITSTLSAMQQAAAPLMPYVGGTPVEYAAIWASQQTQDFRGRLAWGSYWDEYHGANELCLQAHLPSAIVFDDHVRNGDLKRYPVLLAGNAACIDAAQAGQLQKYVEEGGVLVTCNDFGMCDEFGRDREKPFLDEFLGIKRRWSGKGCPTLDIDDKKLRDACGRWVTFRSSHWLAEPTPEAQVLAQIMDLVDRQIPNWNDIENRGTTTPRSPGLWFCRRGRGTVIYMVMNPFYAYIHGPTLHLLRFFQALVTRFASPPITLQGPVCVTMNARIMDNGEWIVHLHNAPGTTYRYPAIEPYGSGELIPIRGLKLCLKDTKVRHAVSVLSGKEFRVSRKGAVVSIPLLERNEAIRLVCNQ